MARRVLREALLFGAILVILAAVLHPDLLSAPQERFARMKASGTHLHPLLYAGGVYLLFALIRGIGRLVRSFFTKTA